MKSQTLENQYLTVPNSVCPFAMTSIIDPQIAFYSVLKARSLIFLQLRRLGKLSVWIMLSFINYCPKAQPVVTADGFALLFHSRLPLICDNRLSL